jgi:UPF0755 protein
MSRPRRIGLIVFLAFVAGIAWLGVLLALPYRAFPSEGIDVEIPAGATVRSVARTLEQKGVVRSAIAFEILCRLRGIHPQAGEYRFHEAASSVAVLHRLAAGDVVYHVVLVPEGSTMFQIADRMADAGLATREEFLAAARDASLVHDLAPEAANLEGFLFPARYEFPRSVTAQEIVRAMVRRFRQVWHSLREAEDANPHRLSTLELVTLASLVERETGAENERGLIAGVFYNRLQKGFPLQCDPTVIYALELAGKYRGQLLLRDLRFDSPYNTYRHRGLPPGPIANPGEAALRAALFPPETDYFYFVSDAQGGHFFSKTLRDHNANVARYRKLLAENQQTVEKQEASGSHAGRNPEDETP